MASDPKRQIIVIDGTVIRHWFSARLKMQTVLSCRWYGEAEHEGVLTLIMRDRTWRTIRVKSGGVRTVRKSGRVVYAFATSMPDQSADLLAENDTLITALRGDYAQPVNYGDELARLREALRDA